MDKYFLEVNITTNKQYENIISNFLISLGTNSVLINSSSEHKLKKDEINLKERKISNNGKITITAYFEKHHDKVKKLIKDYFTENGFEVKLIFGLLKNQDWNAEWKKHFAGININNLVKIIPPWLDKEKSKVPQIIINPAAGFGTGTHPTTYMCLETMKNLKIKNKNVLDAGCGSGIIGITAKVLGANKVFMIDYDEDSLENAKENIALNKLSKNVDIKKMDLSVKKINNINEFDVIYSNIILNVNKDFVVLNKEKIKKSAQIFFTGVLNEQKQNFTDFLKNNNFKIIEVIKKEDWILFNTTKK